MKKNILIAVVLSMFLIMLSSFSFCGGPYNIAAGNYVLVPVNVNNPVYPFYDNASEKEIAEMLFIAADGIWTLLIKCPTADRNLENEFLVGRYQVKDDKVTFWDDTNCCTFTGKITGDRMVVRPEGVKENFLFVRMNSYK